MKTRTNPAVVALFAAVLAALPLAAQPAPDSTGLAGDGFSLEGAIELFKKAASPEDFEKMLNDEASNANNLDLNGDGEADYLRVEDRSEGGAHALAIQALIGDGEAQDVAVIEVEKTGDEEAVLQIVGDADLYGKEIVVEPFDEEEGAKPSKGRGGPAAPVLAPPVRVVVNVWMWPSVRFVYAPGYVAWASPWRWRHYPPLWRPWRPRPFHVWRVGVAPYHRHCHVVTVHRTTRAHAVYAPHRSHSTVTRTRTTTTVHGTGPRGGHKTATKTTTTTTVKGKNGNTRASKTTTTKRVKKGRH